MMNTLETLQLQWEENRVALSYEADPRRRKELLDEGFRIAMAYARLATTAVSSH